MTMVGIPALRASSIKHGDEARLTAARHPHDHAMRDQMMSGQAKGIAAGCAVDGAPGAEVQCRFF